MKTISAIALFAAVGFVAAGCASGSKVLSGTAVRSKVFSPGLITVAGTVTIPKV